MGVLLILRVFEKPIITPVAIAVMLAGIAATLFWKSGLGLSGALYEVLPGMAVGFLVYAVASLLFSSKMQRE